MKKAIYTLLVFLLLHNTSSALQYLDVKDIPDPKASGSGYVSNPDSLISKTEQNILDTLIADLEHETGIQCAVVILDSIGYNIPFDFGVKLFEKWGIGKSGKDNGLLLLITMHPKSWRFYTGYGLESALTDARLKIYGERYLVPEFKQGNYGTGIINAFNEIKSDLLFLNKDVKELDEIYRIGKYENIWHLFWVYAAIMFFYLLVKTVEKYRNDKKKITVQYFILILLQYYIFPALAILPMYDAEDPNKTVILNLYIYFSLLAAARITVKTYSLLHSKISPLEKYIKLTEKSLWQVSYLMITPPVLILYLSIYFYYRKKLRKKSRNCEECSLPLVCLDESSDDKYLSAGQIKEEVLGSKDYDVWICQNGHTEIYFYSPFFKSEYQDCKNCGFKTLKFDGNYIIEPATYSSSGKGLKKYHCENCREKIKYNYKIPIKTKSSSSSSSSSSGGSSSWGGGSTGGGGAGGSW